MLSYAAFEMQSRAAGHQGGGGSLLVVSAAVVVVRVRHMTGQHKLQREMPSGLGGYT
jgi:hypothetical protein